MMTKNVKTYSKYFAYEKFLNWKNYTQFFMTNFTSSFICVSIIKKCWYNTFHSRLKDNNHLALKILYAATHNIKKQTENNI